MTNNESVNLCVGFIPLPILPFPEDRNKSFVEIQFNLFMLKYRSGKQLTKLMVLLTPGKPCHKLESVTPPACLLFEILGECHSLPKGLPANPCKLQMFSQAAHSEETFPIPCKHLSDKSLCHGGATSLELVKWLH